MPQVDCFNGYLDVKIPSKSKRGFTPWKTWKKHWCEIKRLDSIENGVELKLKSSKEGNILNCFILPRSSTICRTESRTKQYAFGIFNLGRKQKPIIFLNGSSETQSQEWMATIRRMLAVASYIPVDNSNFRVSLVDNHHSRAAGLLGTFGVLSISQQDLIISDPCTGEPKITWKWFQFHQFHLQAPLHPEDDQKVIVMHTSSEFPAGPGLLLLYCKYASNLLHHLVARGHFPKTKNRLSRSEGDLFNALNSFHADSPVCLRSQTGSEDSGIRASIVSDDSEYITKSKDASNLLSVGLEVVTKTPGGSETEDSSLDLANIEPKGNIPRNESGISLASGIYEEIPDDYETSSKPGLSSKHTSHVYENPSDVIIELRKTFFMPPPLPPRSLDFTWIKSQITSEGCTLQTSVASHMKPRANTMPAQDLSRISKIFTGESDYVVMSPSKKSEKSQKSTTENFYLPMLPLKYMKLKTEHVTVDLKKT